MVVASHPRPSDVRGVGATGQDHHLDRRNSATSSAWRHCHLQRRFLQLQPERERNLLLARRRQGVGEPPVGRLSLAAVETLG